MRARSLLIVPVLAVLAAFVAHRGPMDLTRGLSPAGPELEGPLSPADRWTYLQRAGEGVISPSAYRRALGQAAAIGDLTARRDPALAEAVWEHMGPTNIGGRVAEIALDPTRADTILAATASGGVWRSADAGLTWNYSWIPEATQATGAMDIGSDGTIYVGTGETNPGGGSTVFGGDGLYRSTDGGATWEHLGLPNAGAFGRIVVDPEDPERVFAAASGPLYVPGGQRGLYRSLDGGDTWERVLAGPNDTTGAADVSISPLDPDHILVGLWDHQRLPTHRRYAGPGSGVHLSTDGGDTWTRTEIDTGLPPEETGRIGVTFAPSNAGRAYAIVANRLNGEAIGLYRSDDGGATWARTGASPGSLSQSSYGWWFGKVWVDPADPDRVFVAGLELVESTDGGDSFLAHGVTTVGVVTGVSQVLPHADQHGMVWDPGNPGRVFLANDGGVYRSDANGRAGTWVNAPVQGWTQHYSVDVSEQSPSRLVSGLQDNMCQRNYLAGNVGHPHTWTKYGLCGDGLQTLINPEDDRLVYGCAQYGDNCSRTEDGGVAFRPLGGTGGRHGWWAPLVFDPNDPNVMYKGSNSLFRSTNGGLNWTQISEDLSTDPEQLDANDGYRIYGTITTVAVAASDPNVLYVGTDDGLVWRTADQGGSWDLLTDPADADQDGLPDNGLPQEWVTRLAVDPADADVAYATFSEFRKGKDDPHVVRTTDGGETWTNVSGNLPDAPVNEIILVPGDRLVVGTDVGAFLSSDGGKTWHRVGSNLPAVPIFDMEYHEGTNTITAATFGHGIQRVTLPS